MLWFILWVMFMVMWLFGGGYYNTDRRALGANCILPWLCVLILGIVLFRPLI
jgi:hypothetical protein